MDASRTTTTDERSGSGLIDFAQLKARLNLSNFTEQPKLKKENNLGAA